MGAKKGEKYYKAKAVVIRELNGIKIVFYDHETIYVMDKNGEWIIFHRWYTNRGFYNHSWRPFRYKMFTQKNLTIEHCYHMAFQHDIVVQTARKAPDLSKFKIEVRF